MSKKILIIEDDKDIVDLLKYYLIKEGNRFNILLDDFYYILNNYCHAFNNFCRPQWLLPQPTGRGQEESIISLGFSPSKRWKGYSPYKKLDLKLPPRAKAHDISWLAKENPPLFHSPSCTYYFHNKGHYKEGELVKIFTITLRNDLQKDGCFCILLIITVVPFWVERILTNE